MREMERERERQIENWLTNHDAHVVAYILAAYVTCHFHRSCNRPVNLAAGVDVRLGGLTHGGRM